MILWTKRDWRGMEHIPAEGGVILVVNHTSHADPLVVAHYIYDSGRWPQFLGKSSLFKLPVMGPILSWCRQIPVQRGTVDAVKALNAAVDAVRGGGVAVIYPEGTTTREPHLWPMRGKTGAARLRLLTGAPVIPIVADGCENLFDPRTKKVGLKPRRPVTVVAGPALDLSKWDGAEPNLATLSEMTEEIMLGLRDLLAEVRGETPPPLWNPSVAKASDEKAGQA
jgi:1-acyl-sn-glycerol-3-phosphate acyltransferase